MVQFPSSNTATSPFHQGEQAVQEKLGVRSIEQWARQVIRPFMPEQHRAFFTAQPFLVAAARDEKDRPWVTLLNGKDGFAKSPDPEHLEFTPKIAEGDALSNAFMAGSDVGLLGIELATRRRNRVNGILRQPASGDILFRVTQSFGNCPQYISERNWHRDPNTPQPISSRHAELSPKQTRWIENSDTFFIGTGYRGKDSHEGYGLDASHRGGAPGFVSVIDTNTIRFPDYSGNNHFNTIGNLVLDNRAGLLFLDFTTGSFLQLTGNISINWVPTKREQEAGIKRLLTLNIEQIVETRHATDLRWDAQPGETRALRVVDKVVESKCVTSFLLQAADGQPLPDFKPGQHLPIELQDRRGNSITRTYSLSSAPFDPVYRISVKREENGLVSSHLHDHVNINSVIKSRKPSGDFFTEPEDTPLVLISAGIGITPVLSMLRTVTENERNRKIHFVHVARNGGEHSFKKEVCEISARSENVHTEIFYSRPEAGDVISQDYNRLGRLDTEALEKLNLPKNADYFICGPNGFMADIQSTLLSTGVDADSIHVESFN